MVPCRADTSVWWLRKIKADSFISDYTCSDLGLDRKPSGLTEQSRGQHLTKVPLKDFLPSAGGPKACPDNLLQSSM